MCVQALCFCFPERAYLLITSLSPLASLWWEAVNWSSGKTHPVKKIYGSTSDISANGGQRPYWKYAQSLFSMQKKNKSMTVILWLLSQGACVKYIQIKIQIIRLWWWMIKTITNAEQVGRSFKGICLALRSKAWYNPGHFHTCHRIIWPYFKPYIQSHEPRLYFVFIANWQMLAC